MPVSARVLAALTLLLAGCGTALSNNRVSLPVVPAWVFATGSQVFTESNLYAGALTEIGNASVFAEIETTDESFVTVDYAWLEALCAWSRDFQKSAGLKWVKDSLDCDKISLGFAFAANVSASREGVTHQPLVFRIFVQQRTAWGGIPAGGSHALVAAMTERGLYVVEPQTLRLTPFRDYPNKGTVYRVRIGG